jgi:methionine-rich copper-binding protein CopC
MFKRKFKQLTLIASIAALLSLLMISSSPAYAVPTITIAVDPNTAAVVGELISSFELQFCEDPSRSVGELNCEIPLFISASADIRDDIVNSGSAATK